MVNIPKQFLKFYLTVSLIWYGFVLKEKLNLFLIPQNIIN